MHFDLDDQTVDFHYFTPKFISDISNTHMMVSNWKVSCSFLLL